MNSDKKKRLIIPVATLMVAIVMMAGVGYAAISSTFTVESNSIQGGELKVSVNDVTTKFFESKKIPYEVHTTNGTPLYKFDSSYDLVKESYNVNLHMDYDDSIQYGMLQFLAYVLDDYGFTEHGSGIGGCWLTEDGERLLTVLDAWYESGGCVSE